MKKWSKSTKILVGIIVILLLLQLIQPAKNHGEITGEKDITKAVQVPENVMAVLKRSCYDCHSNYTTYLWYDRISPVNYWIAHHINEGKHELNFSQFAEYTTKRQRKKLDEVAEQIEKGEMPISSYTLMHTEARLSEADKKLLIDWAHKAEEQVKPP